VGESIDYDICCVGAGPGGLVAGEYAARSGAKVLVIDRKQEIGSPVRCAEGLGFPSFNLLGLSPKSDFVMNKINKAVMFAPSGKKLEIYVPYEEFSLYILDRAIFEKALASRVRSHGGDILLGTTVSGLIKKDRKVTGLKTTKGDITAKVIIGADGVEGRVGRLCGLSKRLKLNEIFTCAQYNLVNMNDSEDHFEIHFGSKYAPGGYAWMFAKGGGEANFGLGVLASTKKRPTELLAKFKKDKASDAKIIRLVAGCIPSTLPLSQTVGENILLVGDAARQTNAVSGGGIANAIIAGKIAGEVSGGMIAEKKPISYLQEYDRLWRVQLEKVLIKKLRQRRFLEDDAQAEKMVRILKIVAKFKPIIPKSLIVRWLSPAF
jgi:digeranylgeranylglycerophospholipid reductase